MKAGRWAVRSLPRFWFAVEMVLNRMILNPVGQLL
jgi:hypothetical protein